MTYEKKSDLNNVERTLNLLPFCVFGLLKIDFSVSIHEINMVFLIAYEKQIHFKKFYSPYHQNRNNNRLRMLERKGFPHEILIKFCQGSDLFIIRPTKEKKI